MKFVNNISMQFLILTLYKLVYQLAYLFTYLLTYTRKQLCYVFVTCHVSLQIQFLNTHFNAIFDFDTLLISLLTYLLTYLLI